jgi:PAS domain S-box-containing protein
MRLSILNPRYSLRARIAFIVAGLTLTLAVIFSIITGEISGRQLKRSIGQTLAQFSSNVVGQLDRTLFERWREIQIVATQDIKLSSNDSIAATRTLLNQMKVTYRFYSWIGWVEPSGKVLVSTDGILEGQDVSSAVWFQQALHSSAPYISSIHSNEGLTSLLPAADNNPDRFIDIAMPVRAEDGTILGVLGTSLDWRLIREQSTSIERQFAVQSGLANNANLIEVFIVAADGTIILGPADYNLNDDTDKLDLKSLQAAKSGQLGYMTEVWPDGNTNYLTGYAEDRGYRGFPGLGWTVLIREQADVALAGVAQLQIVIVGIGVLFAMLFSAIGWLLAIQVTRPLTHIVDLARDLKTGDPQDHDRDRPLHADEVSIISATIDRLLVSLNNRNRQLSEANLNLEQRISERTRELAASQRFNENIVSSVPAMISIRDFGKQQFVYLNQPVTTLLGYEINDLLHSSYQERQILHSDDLKLYDDQQASVCTAPDGVSIEQTYRLKHRDGHWVWILSRESVFTRDAEGRVEQVLGVAQDVTLRKQVVQEEAAAQERQRLARELHDSVSQTLFSATIIAQTLPLIWDRGESVIHKNLDELLRLTQGALAEMRTLLNELRPTAIETADLKELLTQLLDAARGRHQAECLLTIEGDMPLAPTVQVAVYRVAQEALNNIVKHARSKHTAIWLKSDVRGLQMRITDDGRGFDMAQIPADHFGLGIMQERAQEVGAELSVHSQPGQGTEVIFTWKDPDVEVVHYA